MSPFRKKDRPDRDYQSYPSASEGLDPELAELMALEEEERLNAQGSLLPPSPSGYTELDPELAELMRLEEGERGQGG